MVGSIPISCPCANIATTFPREVPVRMAGLFESGSIDVVIASWVLEHLPRPQVTFGEIARVLRPGGRFFFLTPNVDHPLPRLSLALARMRKPQQRVVSRAPRPLCDGYFP